VDTRTNLRRTRLSVALSAVLHGVAVVVAVFLFPKARAPERLHGVLLYVPPKPVRADRFKAQTRAPTLPKTVTSGPAAVGGTDPFQGGEVKVGALNLPNAPVRPSERGNSGSVLIGALVAGTASGGQSAPGGHVGPTDVFNQPGSADLQPLPRAQHGVDEVARLLTVPTPVYSEEARRLNVTGEVVLEVKMAKSGEVRVLRVLSGIGHGLDQAAVDAVNHTRCRPAFKAGVPVDVIATIRVIFKLT